MPFITINIADHGTPIVSTPKTGEPGTSFTGHMWTTLQQDKTSIPISYGFAPAAAHESQPFAPGQVYINDNTNYTNNGQNTPYYSRE